MRKMGNLPLERIDDVLDTVALRVVLTPLPPGEWHHEDDSGHADDGASDDESGAAGDDAAGGGGSGPMAVSSALGEALCYRALELVHRTWAHVSFRVKVTKRPVQTLVILLDRARNAEQ